MEFRLQLKWFNKIKYSLNQLLLGVTSDNICHWCHIHNYTDLDFWAIEFTRMAFWKREQRLSKWHTMDVLSVTGRAQMRPFIQRLFHVCIPEVPEHAPPLPFWRNECGYYQSEVSAVRNVEIDMITTIMFQYEENIWMYKNLFINIRRPWVRAYVVNSYTGKTDIRIA